MTTTATSGNKSRFTSLPVPPPIDPHEIYAPDDFPDATLFDETTCYPAVSVPMRKTAHYKKVFFTILIQGRKNVYPDPHCPSERRILLLNVGVTKEARVLAPTLQGKVSAVTAEATSTPSVLSSSNDEERDVEWIADGMSITTHYTDTTIFTADYILRKLLPTSHIVEVPSSFESVGHIAHVNLRPECLPYKYWIGKVLLDYHQPTIKTVVNKIGTISDNQCIFRTFAMEVLAGNGFDGDKNNGDTTKTSVAVVNGKKEKPSSTSSWSVTTVHEHGCTFTLDYKHVYWNSRLSGEHDRLVQLIRKEAAATTATMTSTEDGDNGDNDDGTIIVADAMAGVGPFAIPLTSTIVNHASKRSLDRQKKKSKATGHATLPLTPPRKIVVYANDLNPVSFQYLQVNAKANKCDTATTLHASNMDARAFLHSLAHERSVHVDHVILNLPASAPEFLDAFRGWPVQPPQRQRRSKMTIHVHCFAGKIKPISTEDGGDLDPSTSKSMDRLKNDIDDDEREGDAATVCKKSMDPHDQAIDRCSAALGCPLDKERDDVRVHIVRDISPGKNMVCVSFHLPPDVHELPRVSLTNPPAIETEEGNNHTEQQQVISEGRDDRDFVTSDTRPDSGAKATTSTSHAPTPNAAGNMSKYITNMGIGDKNATSPLQKRAKLS